MAIHERKIESTTIAILPIITRDSRQDLRLLHRRREWLLLQPGNPENDGRPPFVRVAKTTSYQHQLDKDLQDRGR